MPYHHVLAVHPSLCIKGPLKANLTIFQRWDCPNPVIKKQQKSLDKWQEVKVKPQAPVLRVQTTGLTRFLYSFHKGMGNYSEII